MNIKIFSRSDIQTSVTMPEAITAAKKAFVSLSQGKVNIPLRSSVSGYREQGTALFMPANILDSGFLGVKIVTVFPADKKSGSPSVQAVFVLVNSKTGTPAAFMEASFLTALRTGAASGVATDLMARRNAVSAAVIGAGTQGRTQLEAVCHVRNLSKAVVYDKDRAAARAYVEEMKKKPHPFPKDITAAASPEEAVREADIICTATNSLTPVFQGHMLKKGAHINAIGSFTPDMQEIPEAAVKKARVIVDSISACLAETGDLIIPLKKGLIQKNHIAAEIGQVASGSVSGRNAEDEITLFKSVGLAVQDVSLAGLVWERNRHSGLGTEVEL